MKRRSDFNDLTGQRFNRLLVIDEMPRIATYRQSIWHVRCDCGVEKFAVTYGALMAGKTQSCGCLRKELAKYRGPEKYLRGNRNPLWTTYQGMKQRCYNQNTKAYPSYGGRGIVICQRWLDSFDDFVDDVGERPKDHSLDRINNNGNYEPSNCRWASIMTQAHNKRPSSRLIIFPWNGEELCVAEICRREQVSCDNVRKLLKQGKSIQESVRLTRFMPHRELSLHLLGDNSNQIAVASKRQETGKKLHKRHLIALGRLPSNEENERRKEDIWLRGCMERCAKSGLTYRGKLPSDLQNPRISN